jgi:hypothetical protein
MRRKSPDGSIYRAPWNPTWQSQCTGPDGSYLGELTWDARTGELLRVASIPAPQECGRDQDCCPVPITTAASASGAACEWLHALAPSIGRAEDAPPQWRLSGAVRRCGTYWETHWRTAAGREALLRVNASSGALRQALFASAGVPGLLPAPVSSVRVK